MAVIINKTKQNTLSSYFCFHDVSTSKVPKGAVPLPTSSPMLSCLSLLHMCGVGLCPFNGLFFHLLLKCGRGLSPNLHCQKSISFHNHDVPGCRQKNAHEFWKRK